MKKQISIAAMLAALSIPAMAQEAMSIVDFKLLDAAEIAGQSVTLACDEIRGADTESLVCIAADQSQSISGYADKEDARRAASECARLSGIDSDSCANVRITGTAASNFMDEPILENANIEWGDE